MTEHYPAGPAHVPPSLAEPTASYKRHAWFAVLGLSFFMTLYFALMGWFFWTALRYFTAYSEGGSVWAIVLAIPPVFLGAFLLKALFFKKQGGVDGSIEVMPDDEPELFVFLHRLADEAGAPRPHKVFLSSDVNACVYYDMSLLNLILPSKKNLEMGLGLVNALDLGELKAVLAHEFGHFAQSTMAVGRWVYVAQRIAAHIVYSRGAFDKILDGLSNTDYRVAWIGWVMRTVVWALRSVLDTVFTIVVLSERALSREMEYQADLVAVTLTGSDALINALHRLHAADMSLDESRKAAHKEIQEGHLVADLFAIQTWNTERLRRILDDPEFGQSPVIPTTNAAKHRVFDNPLAQPPRMWSTHPANSDREENAKRHYVEAPIDGRPSWALFRDPKATREAMTHSIMSTVYAELPEKIDDAEETLTRLTQEYDATYLHPRYRGTYLGRRITRTLDNPEDLFRGEPCTADIPSRLQALYPPELKEKLEVRTQLDEERTTLEALRDGFLKTSDGLIHHRGEVINKGDLPDLIESISREYEGANALVAAHDLEVHATHLAAARTLGDSWVEHLRGLAQLLHYAEHSLDNLTDASGQLNNVTAVVTADGHVSAKELRRLMAVATDLQSVIAGIYDQQDALILGDDVSTRLQVSQWSDMFDEELGLPPPHKDQIDDWMSAVDSWVSGTASQCEALRHTALEALLDAEELIAESFRNEQPLGEAPASASLPDHYERFLVGKEREIQNRLGLWDRFVIADGFFPSLARFTVAATIVAATMGAGMLTGDATVTVYNGLHRDIVVNVGDHTFQVLPLGVSEELSVAAAEKLHITTKTLDGTVIEEFDATNVTGFSHSVYNVASASPLVHWYATYGEYAEMPPNYMGAPRWVTTTATHVFEEPPETLSFKGRGTMRSVLSAIGEGSPAFMVNNTESDDERQELIRAHVRWDNSGSEPFLDWLQILSSVESGKSTLTERLRREPTNIALLRALQRIDETDSEPCNRQRALAEGNPDNFDFRYLAYRCIEDDHLRADKYIADFEEGRESGWFAWGAAYAFGARGQWSEAKQALDISSEKLPQMAGVAAIEAARMERVLSSGKLADMRKFAVKSRYVAEMVQIETGAGDLEGEMAAYGNLHRGKIDEAASVNFDEGMGRARLLRLAAVSDNAPKKVIDEALALPHDAGIDDTTRMFALALVRKEKKDFSGYEEELAALEKYDQQLLKLLTSKNIAREMDKLESLPSYKRGQAYAIGSILVDEAPPKWREMAKALLFSYERPFFL